MSLILPVPPNAVIDSDSHFNDKVVLYVWRDAGALHVYFQLVGGTPSFWVAGAAFNLIYGEDAVFNVDVVTLLGDVFVGHILENTEFFLRPVGLATIPLPVTVKFTANKYSYLNVTEDSTGMVKTPVFEQDLVTYERFYDHQFMSWLFTADPGEIKKLKEQLWSRFEHQKGSFRALPGAF